MAVEVYLGDAPNYVKQWVESYYEKFDKPLCFTAVDAGATIQLAKTGNPDPIEIVYSTDKTTWNDYDFIITVTLANAGDKVYFKAKNENDVSFYKGYSNYYRFVTTDDKRVAASGNLQTLMKADGSRLDISDKPYCYSYMFQGCTSLTQTPELPATTLADYCYSYMFFGCTSLTQAPTLPATTLADSCYSNMFFSCTALTQAPALPATTLADSCYSYMFNVVGQPLAFSDKTTNDIADYIADEHLIGDYAWYSPDTSELISPVVIICTDGQLSATFDENTYTWTIQIESL